MVVSSSSSSSKEKVRDRFFVTGIEKKSKTLSDVAPTADRAPFPTHFPGQSGGRM